MDNGAKRVGESSGQAKTLPDRRSDPGSARESADEAFGKVLQLVRNVQTGMQNIDDRHGLSGSQLWALWQISAQPGMRVSEIARALQIKPSTASNLLDKLESRQLVRRERRDVDNRVVCLYLTDQGIALVKDLPGPMQGRLRGALGAMPPSALANLWQGMSSLLKLMGDSTRPQVARSKG
ncbi:MAG: MarR family transcriptional regulator [Candidatus Accumulibacter sp.]|uniref:MarR family winged helix-turn-helix transcriptional regulator n=1 Tax=Accumulibacter sp. TaxID=2053492 RepID=UPI001A0DDECD|nr:MarR family transcriptional regulator [Accumulibacter sp.]MBE2257292.1 MarR family transcriptional regulator [Paracoccaceae bacterium]MCP5247053.1 MarR family transcriptional regulator [Accumulibacter sp.]